MYNNKCHTSMPDIENSPVPFGTVDNPVPSIGQEGGQAIA